MATFVCHRRQRMYWHRLCASLSTSRVTDIRQYVIPNLNNIYSQNLTVTACKNSSKLVKNLLIYRFFFQNGSRPFAILYFQKFKLCNGR